MSGRYREVAAMILIGLVGFALDRIMAWTGGGS
jgi:hypothetical protein